MRRQLSGLTSAVPTIEKATEDDKTDTSSEKEWK